MSLSIILLLMVFAFLIYKMLKDLAFIWMYTVIIRTTDKDAEAKRNNSILLKVMKTID